MNHFKRMWGHYLALVIVLTVLIFPNLLDLQIDPSSLRTRGCPRGPGRHIHCDHRFWNPGW